MARHRRARVSASRARAGPVIADLERARLAVLLPEPRRLVAVEADLAEVEQHERREDLDLALAHGGDREGQEAMGVVAAEDVEAERAGPVAVDDQVHGPSHVDSTHANRQSEQLLGAPHAPMVARRYSSKPSAPTSGTKRQVTEWTMAGPSGLRIATSSRWLRSVPTGTTRRPRGFSCS